MPFVEMQLSDVELEKPSPIGNGRYVFQLNPGADYRIGKYSGTEELNVSATVVSMEDGSDSEFKGRVQFFSFPDPAVKSKNGKDQKWSAQALKKLEISLGVDALPGEDPKTYLNRVASNGAARFAASVIPDKKILEGETEPRPKFSLFSFGPAA